MTRERLSAADRAALAASLERESAQRDRVRMGRWTARQLLDRSLKREHLEEGLAAIIRLADAERTKDAIRAVGIALGQLCEAGHLSAEEAGERQRRFMRGTIGRDPSGRRSGALAAGFLVGQTDVRRARDPQHRPVPRRPQPSARSLAGPWTLRELAAGNVVAKDADAALAAIVGRLRQGSTSADLIAASRAAGQLAVVIDWRRLFGALEAAGRRAGLRDPRHVVYKGLDIGMGELAAAERAA